MGFNWKDSISLSDIAIIKDILKEISDSINGINGTQEESKSILVSINGILKNLEKSEQEEHKQVLFQNLKLKIKYLLSLPNYETYYADDDLLSQIDSLAFFILNSIQEKYLSDRVVLLNAIEVFSKYFIEGEKSDIVEELLNLEQYAIEDSQIYELLHTIYFYLRVWFVDNRYIKIPSTNNILTDIALQDKAIELWQTQREEIKQKYKSFWDGSSEAEKWNEFVEASIDKKIKAIKLIESSNSEEIKKIVEDVKKQFSTNAKVRLKTNPYIRKI